MAEYDAGASKYVGYDIPDDTYVLTFGKHKGKHWNDVPTTYLQWLVKNSYDQLLVKAVNKYLVKVRHLPEDWEQLEAESLYDEGDGGYR